ncbi:MAG: hypothetical protein ACTHMI_20190 [Mucilaginibacter sp.]
MNTLLHCTNYDEQLQTALPHLKKYPQMLPFIGSAWTKAANKILFIGESHYLPNGSKIKNNSDDWYAGSADGFTGEELGHTSIRDIIADMEHGPFNKGYTIFYNLKRGITQVHPSYQHNEPLFHNFGYYNYFQRPAEINGGSIKNSRVDNQIAYKTLKTIVAISQPTTLIFVSKKAVHSFWDENAKDSESAFPERFHLPHPASAWWNKKHKERYDSTEVTTGKERFIKIITDLNLQLNVISE